MCYFVENSLHLPFVSASIDGLRRIARIACKCVRMRGKKRLVMGKVTTGLERKLAILMGSPREEKAVPAMEVMLGSRRMNNSSSNYRKRGRIEEMVVSEGEMEGIEDAVVDKIFFNDLLLLFLIIF